MSTVWKDIDGYIGRYQVSSAGEVRNTKTLRILQQSVTDRYMKVNLSSHGISTTYRVHRLVALAFIPNPKAHTEVDHINEDKTHNAVSNLRWCSSLMNKQFYAFGRKGTPVLRRKTGVKPVGVHILVNGVQFPSLHQAARHIATAEGKNEDTVRRELRRFAKGLRPSWHLYGKYHISS